MLDRDKIPSETDRSGITTFLLISGILSAQSRHDFAHVIQASHFSPSPTIQHESQFLAQSSQTASHILAKEAAFALPRAQSFEQRLQKSAQSKHMLMHSAFFIFPELIMERHLLTHFKHSMAQSAQTSARIMIFMFAVSLFLLPVIRL